MVAATLNPELNYIKAICFEIKLRNLQNYVILKRLSADTQPCYSKSSYYQAFMSPQK